MNKEVVEIKQDIPKVNKNYYNFLYLIQLKEELNETIYETKMINTIIGEETKQIDLLKDDIRKLNKKISDVEVILQFNTYFT